MKIRPATLTDLPAIQACAREAYAQYVPRIGRDPAPMVADFEGQILDEIVSVAEHNGGVAGFVVFYPRGDHMHLENVAVASAVQGGGVGSRLIAFVETEAQRQGLSHIELYTNEKMTENIPYYRTRGYVETERRQEDGFNRIFFRKDIG